MKLLVATTNPGKQKEIRLLLADPKIELLFPTDIPELKDFEVDESGSTFEANALLKAQAFGDASGLLTVADDSGLSVTAFDGFPGVMSNRWHPGPSRERVQALLDKMSDVTDRRAAFVTTTCLYNPQDKSHLFFTAQIDGTVGTEICGTQGFDYDFIFIPDGYTQTFSELGTEKKNEFSQRAEAFKKVKEYLLKN